MTQAETIPVSIPRRDGEPPYRGIVVRLRDGDGVTGAGEAAVLGEREGGIEAASRVAREIAELDLRARRAGVRLADLLGGVRRASVECTALVIDPRAGPAAHEVERRAAEGFRAFKLKSANAGGAVDGERLGGARWAAGHGARLRLDFNGALSEGRAVSMLPTLELFSLELVEQPLAAGTPVDGWTRVQAATGMPLAADESLADHALACALARAGFVLALKLVTAGGPRAVLGLAAAATGRVTIGSGMESSLGLAAALHVACALAAEPLACGLATLDRLDGDLAGGLEVGPVLRLPPGPGLGVELDEAALARYRTDR
jgi:L-alanine-DL-glutamate epimerase-like enolase superfamily enzyme